MILVHLFIVSLNIYHFFIDTVIFLNVILILYLMYFYISMLIFIIFISCYLFISINDLFYFEERKFVASISCLTNLFVVLWKEGFKKEVESC
jgi:hypothetical protein